MPIPVFPILDAGLEYAGVSKLRTLNAKRLEELARPLALLAPGGGVPLAVIVPYQIYMGMQAVLMRCMEMAAAEAGKIRLSPTLDQ